jgi:hypothetical protein
MKPKMQDTPSHKAACSAFKLVVSLEYAIGLGFVHGKINYGRTQQRT